MSLLQIRQQALNIFRSLRPEMAWKDVSNFSTKLCFLQGRLDKWHKALPASFHFSLPVEPNDTCVETIAEARPRFHECLFVEAIELISRHWLYICFHIKSRHITDMQIPSDIEQAMQAHFTVKARETALQHQKAVLLGLHFESMGQFFRGREIVSGGPWFKANNCLVLALLLMASHIGGSQLADSDLNIDNHLSEALQNILSTLAADDSSELNMPYVELLQYILAEFGRKRRFLAHSRHSSMLRGRFIVTIVGRAIKSRIPR